MKTFNNPWDISGEYYTGWFDASNNEALSHIGQIRDRNIQIEGPFDGDGQKISFVSREVSYAYVATINNIPTNKTLKDIRWAVSYDDDLPRESFFLFRGGIIEGNKIRVEIQIAKGVDTFRIYGYYGIMPNMSAAVKVSFKKVVAFFLGGAGDKEPYAGQGPSEIIEDKVRLKFNQRISSIDYRSYYLSYKDAYKDEILSKIIPNIPSKEGTAINIIGHSLGGWNGAHLSQILTDAGYNVVFLATLDPVGTKIGVTVISDIYGNYPSPKSNYWINVFTEPEEWDADDFVAWGGGQWMPDEDITSISEKVDVHHREAGKLFHHSLKNKGISISDFLLHFITLFINSK